MSFPTTNVLDSGSGADQNPVAGNWTSPVWSETAMQRLGGKFAGTSGSWNSMAWSANQYGPDCEHFATIDTRDSTANLVLRLKANVIGSSAATLNDYYLYVNNGTGTVAIGKEVSGSGTQLGSWSQALSSGDSIGIQAVGSTIGAWYKAAGGSWTQLGTVTDSTYSGQSGYLVLEAAGGTVRFTNMGGGTYNPATVPTNSAAPTISGHPNVGQPMASTTGTWLGSPTSFAYQWQTSPDGSTGWANIAGATASIYTATAVDTGNWLRCNVIASNAAGPSSAASSAASLVAVAASVSFPLTPIVFDPSATSFDENPLSQGGQFAGPIYPGANENQLKLLTKQVVPTTAASDNQSRTTTSYGADSEVYVTVPTLPPTGGAILIWARIANPNTASMTGYLWMYLVGTGWRYYRRDSSTVVTQLGVTDTSYTLVAGDSMGFSIVGSTLTGFHAPAGKPWVAHTTASDATYSAAGLIGWELDTTAASTVGALTLLGGGTIPVSATNSLTTLHAG